MGEPSSSNGALTRGIKDRIWKREDGDVVLVMEQTIRNIRSMSIAKGRQKDTGGHQLFVKNIKKSRLPMI